MNHSGDEISGTELNDEMVDEMMMEMLHEIHRKEEIMRELLMEMMQRPLFGDSVIHLLNPITEGYGGIYTLTIKYLQKHSNT